MQKRGTFRMANLAQGRAGLLLCLIFLVVQTSSSQPEERDDLFEGDLNIPELSDASRDDVILGTVLGASRFGRWPNGVMPYVISSKIGSSDKSKIFAAMKEWSHKTCINFVQRTEEKSYVVFITENNGCWSDSIGRNGRGKQHINLDTGCWRHGTIIHEIGHALGFWHEQSRPDRDDYVSIKRENIRQGAERQFKKYSHGQIDSLGVVYDYGSVMHYPRWAFSKNGRDTIVPKKAGAQIGQRSRLSDKDALQANLMYCKNPQGKLGAPEGNIIHLQSMKCFSPADGKVLGESHPVVLSKCNNQASRFRMYENGTIQHVPSGMCVHPTGGCSLPEDNTELVLSKRCNGKKENFLFNRDGLLIHSSKKCARPAHDSDKVPDNTRVVVHQFCTALKFAFAFSALSRKHDENLALRKPARQISTNGEGVASRAVDGVRNGNYHDGFCSHTMWSKTPWWRVDLEKQERIGFVYVSNRADCCWDRLSDFEIRVGNSVTIHKNPRCGMKYSLNRGETREIVCNPPLDGRYVSISMTNPKGSALTLCEVAVYESETNPTQKPTKPEIKGVPQHSKSKLCVLPKYEGVSNNSAVVLTAKCLENAARFRNLAQGSLQHVDSGMCLSPKDGCMKSLKDTELVLIDQCGKKETEFSFTDEGSLEHMASKTCARPSSTPVTNEDTTLIVLNAQCDPSNNRFELVTVPTPTPTSLPAEGKCGQVLALKSPLVVGGVDARHGAWPWQVALKRNGRFICGGSLIKPNWVVTAAHCIDPRASPNQYAVVLGEYDRRTTETSENEIAVKRYIRHSRFNKPYPINNDIALLELVAPTKITSLINTVCLPSHDYALSPVTSRCYITASSSLTVTESMICGGKGSDVSGCHGDSGGPYVCQDKGGRWFLQGVVSWGNWRCRASVLYTVFARVAKYRNWIDDNIGK